MRNPSLFAGAAALALAILVFAPAALAVKAFAPGDPVRSSYDDAGGGNLSKTFKKAEGC